MDMNELDLAPGAEAGATMPVCHPVTDEVLKGNDDNPMTITLMGADSATFKRAIIDIQQATKPGKKLSAAEQERNTINALARITIGWSKNWTWDGKPFEFSAENARRLYAERPWVRGQVDEFIADRSAFFQKA